MVFISPKLIFKAPILVFKTPKFVYKFENRILVFGTLISVFEAPKSVLSVLWNWTQKVMDGWALFLVLWILQIVLMLPGQIDKQPQFDYTINSNVILHLILSRLIHLGKKFNCFSTRVRGPLVILKDLFGVGVAVV